VSAARLLSRFKFQTANQKQARTIARIFCPAPGRPPSRPCAPGQEPRARGTPRVRSALTFTQVGANKSTRTHGPRRLATSRLVEVLIVPQVRQTQGVPRAVFLGLLRSAPGGLTVSGAAPFGRGAYPPLSVAQWPAGLASRDESGLDRRVFTAHLRCKPFPATAPRPASGDADQTPLGCEGRDLGILS